MNTAIKLTLAAALATAGMVPLAYAAETATPHVSIVYIDTLSDDGDGTAFDLASAVRGALFVASFVTLVTIVAVAARRRQLAAQLKAE